MNAFASRGLGWFDGRAAERRQRVSKQTRVELPVICIAPRGLNTFRGLTQGSQSLALGLTLSAASQLVDLHVSFHSCIRRLDS